LSFSKVLYVPGLSVNLISVSRITSAGGNSVSFSGDSATVTSPSGDFLFRADRHGKIYRLAVSPLVPLYRRTYPANAALTLLDLHRRLGHLNFHDVRLVAKASGYGAELGGGVAGSGTFCKECALGKLRARAFPPSSTPRAEKIGRVLHSDVCGPFPLSRSGKLYFVSFIDDHSRRPFVYFLRHKSDVHDAFQHLKAQLSTRFDCRLELLRTDRGGEYVNGRMEAVAAKEGWRHELTAPDTPQQNGTAERFNRSLQERMVTILAESAAPVSFWPEAAAFVVYTLLHSPHAALDKLTPASFWPTDRSIPPATSLRPFGCAAYPLLTSAELVKLGRKSVECAFLGFEPASKAYRLWDFQARRVRISTSVRFDERRFPWHDRADSRSPRASYDVLLPFPSPPRAAYPNPPAHVDQEEQEQGEPHADGNEGQGEQGQEEENEGQGEQGQEGEQEHGSDPGSSEEDDEPGLAAGRARRSTIRHDYRAIHARGLAAVVSSGPASLPPNFLLAEADELRDDSSHVLALAGDLASDADYSLLDPIQDKHSSLVAGLIVSLGSDTPSQREATTGPESAEWSTSDARELDAIAKNDTADLVHPSVIPRGTRVLPTHWVRRKKRRPSGEVLKFKSRVVVNGSLQQEGVDYTETFASVGKAPTLRLLYALTALFNLTVESYDVDSAFLGAEIDQAVFVRPPAGFQPPPGKDGYVWRLKKSLYGLKQSPRLWKQRLTSILNDVGFVQSRIDDGLFILRKNGRFAFHYLHVDDGKIFSDSPALVAEIR
ncbi:hypothetical protein JCM5296_002212, partial [Sporobolomyces johnsonii]